MAPVRHAAHSLHAARPIRRAHVGRRVFLLLGKPVVVASVEALLEATAHRVPVLAERVTCDGFLGRDLDVVRHELGAYPVPEGAVPLLDRPQLVALNKVDSPDARDLAELGEFRLQAARTPDGDLLVTGLPLNGVRLTLLRLAAVEGAVALLALTSAGLVGAQIVRRTLRPLDAATVVDSVKLISTEGGQVMFQSPHPIQPNQSAEAQVGRDQCLAEVDVTFKGGRTLQSTGLNDCKLTRISIEDSQIKPESAAVR